MRTRQTYTPISVYNPLSQNNIWGIVWFFITVAVVWIYVTGKGLYPINKEAFFFSLQFGGLLYAIISLLFFWRFPKGNWAMVFKNILRSERVPTDDRTITETVRPPTTQMGVFGGPTWVPPWWRPVEPAIQLVTGPQIDRKIEVNDKWNQTFVIHFIMNHKPAVGEFLPNYHQFTNEQAIEVAVAEIERLANGKFVKFEGDDVRKDLEGANKWFAHVLGGDHVMSNSERRTGRVFFGLSIKSIKQGAEAQRAAEGVNEAEKAALAINKLRKEAGLEPEMAAVLYGTLQDKGSNLHYFGGNFSAIAHLMGLFGANQRGQQGGGNRRRGRGRRQGP